ncbi:MAG: hypothetical protein WCE32_21575, partial [Pseudolabrys sp.]
VIDMAQHLLSVDATRVMRILRRTWFVPGPLYFSGVYLGDDPDPNIRFQIPARYHWPVWRRLQLTAHVAGCEGSVPV